MRFFGWRVDQEFAGESGMPDSPFAGLFFLDYFSHFLAAALPYYSRAAKSKSNRVLYFAAYGALSPVFGASRQTVLPRQGNPDLSRLLRVKTGS